MNYEIVKTQDYQRIISVMQPIKVVEKNEENQQMKQINLEIKQKTIEILNHDSVYKRH